MWSLPPHNGFSLEKEILTHGNLEDIMLNEANQLENTYFTYEVPRVVRGTRVAARGWRTWGVIV